MFHRDPILVKAPMGRIYAFTRYYRGNNIFDGPHLAFPHDRGFARERLLDLTRHIGDDPFNDRLHDVWQMVFQKPWTRPKSLHELVMDLTDKITRGELFVYEERDPDRSHRIPIHDGPSEGGPAFVDRGDVRAEKSPMDRPRVTGPPVSTSASWGSDYADGLSDTASAMASDIASEQTELYENTSGWGNVMYPIFKPVENAGRFVGNTVGLLSGLSPNGMKPEVAQYWKDMGEGFQALGDRVVDAVGGDGRAAGEITPAIASVITFRRIPDAQKSGLDKLVPDDHFDQGLDLRADTAFASEALARKLSALEDAQRNAARVETLEDGRILYIGPEKPARNPGPTRGAALVTEYTPETRQVRQYYESYDHNGDIVRVHPKMIDGQVVESDHYPPTGREIERN
ncbi:hypothetical protein [Marinobacter sp. OP 3.4]|uniref:hypothetical protein n=1 Tax=Marinobacter sp. OP 3.4 TaxID=3076501 RepID=UPI002E1F9232